MKSILEYSPKYGPALIDDVKKYGEELIKRTKNEIGKFFYRNDRRALAYLWVWCIHCPYCKQRFPLTNQMWIVQTENKKIGVRFKVTDDYDFQVELIKDMQESEGKQFTQKRGKAICIRCRNSINYEHLTNDMATNSDREIIAVMVQGFNGKDYEKPNQEDERLYFKADSYLKQKWKEYEDQNLIPLEEIKPRSGNDNPLWHYGIRKWYQFFNHRQLLVMSTVLKNIREISKEITDKEYAKVIVTFLSFLLCKHVNSNSLGVIWNKGAEKGEHALLARRPHIVYNFVEINPFETGRGVLKLSLKM